MNEEIRLPEEPSINLNYDSILGCITIRPAKFLDNLQPIVLTCTATDVILAKTDVLGIVEDVDLGGSELVLGFGYPESLDSLGEDN